MEINAVSKTHAEAIKEQEERNNRAVQDKTKELTSTDFFKLLAVQLTNQDPMEPMDNSDFVAQMAQFSSLANSNDQLSKLDKVIGALERLGDGQNNATQIKHLDGIKNSVDLLREEIRGNRNSLETAASAA